jgi:hypothetical protein
MYDLAFESYSQQVLKLFTTAVEIGISVDELLEHLSSVHSEGTPVT